MLLTRLLLSLVVGCVSQAQRYEGLGLSIEITAEDSVELKPVSVNMTEGPHDHVCLAIDLLGSQYSQFQFQLASTHSINITLILLHSEYRNYSDLSWKLDLKRMRKGQIRDVYVSTPRNVHVSVASLPANAIQEPTSVVTRAAFEQKLSFYDCTPESASVVRATARDADEWTVTLAPPACLSPGCAANDGNSTTASETSSAISWVWPLIVFVNLLLAALGLFLIFTVIRRKKLFGSSPARTVILPMLEVRSRNESGGPPPAPQGSNGTQTLGSPPSYQEAVGVEREEARAAVAAAWARDRTQHDSAVNPDLEIPVHTPQAAVQDAVQDAEPTQDATISPGPAMVGAAHTAAGVSDSMNYGTFGPSTSQSPPATPKLNEESSIEHDSIDIDFHRGVDSLAARARVYDV